MASIAAEPQKTLNLMVCHGRGGDTSARVAATLRQQGRPVDMLVTVDAVSRGIYEAYFRRAAVNGSHPRL